MIDLNLEFLHAMGGLDSRAVQWLLQQGVPDIALRMWPGPMGVASIETHPLGFFDFSEQGRGAFIHPTLSGPAFTDIVDLIAWYPDQPSEWWTLCGFGVPLGIDQLDRAELQGEPVLLHSTPLDWLRANGEGVCVLDWPISGPALRRVPQLVCENAAFGRFVHDILSVPPMPVPEIHIIQKDAA